MGNKRWEEASNARMGKKIPIDHNHESDHQIQMHSLEAGGNENKDQ